MYKKHEVEKYKEVLSYGLDTVTIWMMIQEQRGIYLIDLATFLFFFVYSISGTHLTGGIWNKMNAKQSTT